MTAGARPSLMLLAAVLAGACGGSRRLPPPRVPPSGVEVGACADPARDGVLGASPKLGFANRDLDGDGTDEIVVADRALCSAEGNCYWNVFVAGSCTRYVGTLAGAVLEATGQSADGGFADLWVWWRFAGGRRLLLQEFRFVHGGYRAVDAVLCAERRGDAIACAPPTR